MRYTRTSQPMRCFLLNCAALLAAIGILGPACRAQDKPSGEQPKTSSASPLEKYPGLLEGWGHLLEKLKANVQFPAARTESRLLPRQSSSVLGYAALPNYGPTARQALETLRQAVEEHPALRAWWRSPEVAKSAEQVERFLEKFAQLHEYLGEEIVFSVALEGPPPPRLLLVAEIRKPGFREFLQALVTELGGPTPSGVHLLGPGELAAEGDALPKDDLRVLIRPELAVASLDLDSLRGFSAAYDAGRREFASTPFGQRALQEFPGGLTILLGVDLQEILGQILPDARANPVFQRTGFNDVKYFIWGHKEVTGKTVSHAELSFVAPRRRIASWLAKPGPLRSLDFVSPGAMLVGALGLKDPVQIFEEVRELATIGNPNAFAALEQFEQALGLSLKDDLLGLLGGELAWEIIDVSPPLPVWKAILSVRNPERLQQTLNTLLQAAPFPVERTEEGGVTYQTIAIPNPENPMQVGYSIVDNYLVVGSGRDVLADAVRLRRSGESLAASARFQAALPPGHSRGASALLFMDAASWARATTFSARQMSPEIGESLSQAWDATPAVFCVDAEETAIRQSTASPAFDVTTVMVVAAIAIPNLLRARITANETSAVGSLRSVVTAQVVYASTFPDRGYAPYLATLGPGPSGEGRGSAEYADLLDSVLANPTCTGETSCTKSGYNFRLTAVCTKKHCDDYVVLATPVTHNTTGIKSFCSTSEGVIRMTEVPPPPALSIEQCKEWPPVQ